LPVVFVVLPVVAILWNVRITDRFKQPEDLLQES
jgi:hypothetical protein